MKFDVIEEIVVDNSKFIGIVKLNFNSNDLDKTINFLKKEYKKSRHICYAYKTKIDGIEYKKFNDDGEPKGTAGLPILSVIDNTELNDVLVLVVRYFGGKKLGASKLLRTYRKSANEAIKKIREGK